ncbi:hypothetical protein G7Y89_g5309 [Cudoniella acicularis]|uniref:NmrA-like domain-containing protein n=1 Tax=Cudoniella acicularis TaxID=354080 RepID=A0A8H4W445_9HELO|nr:hypothetical protein G7Y89_g5309 [Cudoniella acicularis]
MSQSFMVTGATGYQGGCLAKILLAQKHTVHALVRDPTSEKARALESQGAILFKGSFDDQDAIQAAISGVSGIFLNPFPTPMAPDLQIEQAKNIINAAVKEKCALVLSTAFLTAHEDAWSGSGPEHFLYLYYSRKSAIEALVRAAPLKSYAILRPTYLMHNYLLPFSLFHYPDLPKTGVLKHMYNHGRRFFHLDSADVGKISAAILLNPAKYDKLELDLSAENLDGDEAVEVIKKVSGRDDIKAERIVVENFDPIVKTGLTWHYFANTTNVELANSKEVEEKFGFPLTTFEDYLEREKVLLLESLPPVE